MTASDDPERELAELRARYAALEAEAEALRTESAETTRELLRALADQRTALEQSAHALAASAALGASNTGRLISAYARWRQRGRGLANGWRQMAAKRRARRRRIGVPRAVMAAAPGVNVAGYINAESGMGEATRCSIRALHHAGIPVALNNVPGPQRMADTTFTDFVDDNPHPFNLIHLNADNMAWFAASRERKYFSDRYTIGYWFWELESFRPDWLSAFDHVDEVWVASEHSRRSIGHDAPVPVVHVPLGLPEAEYAQVGREHFGIPERPFVFLYTFDVSSQMERKNPLGAVRAFRLAGLPHDRALLLLKFTNAQADREAVRRLADAASGLNVQMIDGALERREVSALMRATDCCLSLHRAEGFGLTLAEQMAMGKPAIATAYSGNLDFMTPEVSRLVPARTVRIDRDYGPYLAGYAWADPDLDAAAQYIRELALAPDHGRALGARGAAHVRKVLSLDRSAGLMKTRLREIRAGALRVSGAAPSPDAPDPAYA